MLAPRGEASHSVINSLAGESLYPAAYALELHKELWILKRGFGTQSGRVKGRKGKWEGGEGSGGSADKDNFSTLFDLFFFPFLFLAARYACHRGL